MELLRRKYHLSEVQPALWLQHHKGAGNSVGQRQSHLAEKLPEMSIKKLCGVWGRGRRPFQMLLLKGQRDLN